MPVEPQTRPWLLFQGGQEDRASEPRPHVARFESIGLELPARRRSTREVVEASRLGRDIRLEDFTGIEERRVCGEGEDSLTLAIAAARDCLAHSDHEASDLEMIIHSSITHYRGGLVLQPEPPLAVAIAQAIGARPALAFDLTNACAGMMTGAFVLNDFIRRGAIRRGMVVSGEYITSISDNAAPRVRTLLSKHLASLTVGDAGAAAILDRAPEGVPGVALAGFTTLAEHSRLCIGAPSRWGPGASMVTQARAIHGKSIEISPGLIGEVLERAGVGYDEIDYVIPHQTSARAIQKGSEAVARTLGVESKPWVTHLAEHGNTSSTTHFVALHRLLEQRHFKIGDKILLLAYASGLEFGAILFTMDELVERYGHPH